MTYFSGDVSQLQPMNPIDGSVLVNGALPTIPFGGFFAGLAPVGIGVIGLQTPTTEAMRQPAAATIQRCYRWMEVAAPALPQVAALAPVLVTAVQQYAAQQYEASLHQATLVVQLAQQLRAIAPGLPAL